MYVWGPCNNLLEVYMSIKEKNMFFKVARPRTVRKKLSKIENSINIYSLGGVTPIYRWISMIYDFHSTPVVKIHENFNFLPIFFIFFYSSAPTHPQENPNEYDDICLFLILPTHSMKQIYP